MFKKSLSLILSLLLILGCLSGCGTKQNIEVTEPITLESSVENTTKQLTISGSRNSLIIGLSWPIEVGEFYAQSILSCFK